MKIDHLTGQQVESIEGQSITFQSGAIVHAATDVPAEIVGLTLINVSGQDDPAQQTEMTFGFVTVDTEGNYTVNNEYAVLLDSQAYGIATSGESEVAYPERAEEEIILSADPSGDRVVNTPLEPSQMAAEAPESRSQATTAPKKGKPRVRKE